jgi:hypothetical protein
VNVDAVANMLQKMERYPGETARLFRGISGYSPTFRTIVDDVLSANEEA